MLGIFEMQHQVEHSMVRRTVITGYAGSIKAEDHGLTVETDVEIRLVDGAGQEGGYTATPVVVHPVAIPAAAVTACCSAMPTSMPRSGKAISMNGSKTGRVRHGRGDRHESWLLLGQLHRASVNAAV